MKRFSVILAVLLSVLLSSCTTTSYQKLDSSVGYWDESINQSADTFKIGLDASVKNGKKWSNIHCWP